MWIKRCALFLIMVAAALAGSACKKPENTEPTENADTFGESPFLALDGSQSQAILLDVDQIRRLPAYKDLKAKLQDQEGKAEWEDLKLAVGGEPLDIFNKILMANYPPRGGKPGPKLIIGVGQFANPLQLVNAYVEFMKKRHLDAAGAVVEDKRDGVPLYQVGDVKFKGSDQPGGLFFAFPTSKIVVFSTELSAVNSTLDVMAGVKPSLMTQPVWRGRLGTPGLLGSMVWAVGEVSIEHKKRVAETVKAIPEMAQFRYLDNAQAFAIKLKYTGRDYLLEGDFICDEGLRALAMKDDLDKARATGRLGEAITMIFSIAPERTPTLDRLLKDTLLTTLETNVRATLRKSPSEGDALLKEWLNPPEAAPAAAGGEGQSEQIEAPGGSPSDAAADPFADAN